MMNLSKKQASIRDSYIRMGVEPTFSCTPYDIFDLPEKNTQVSFAESNAAIFANSLGGLKTNKESAFSALASAITGKSPYSDLRKDDITTPMTIRMKMDNPSELRLWNAWILLQEKLEIHLLIFLVYHNQTDVAVRLCVEEWELQARVQNSNL